MHLETPLHGVLACALAGARGVGCLVASRRSAARVRPPGRQSPWSTSTGRVAPHRGNGGHCPVQEIADDASIAAAHRRSAGWVAGLILLIDHSAVGVLAAPTRSIVARAVRYCAAIFETRFPPRHDALLSIAMLPA
jgi:hypothetical protein